MTPEQKEIARHLQMWDGHWVWFYFGMKNDGPYSAFEIMEVEEILEKLEMEKK